MIKVLGTTFWYKTMGELVSEWSTLVPRVPESYIFPPEKRPGNVIFPLDNSIPVIDLKNHDKAFTIKQIKSACQEFGIFQVINHGVSEELMDDVMAVLKDFFAMPTEEKTRECSKDKKKRSCKLYTSSENYSKEELHYWRDAISHLCHPLEEHLPYWPSNPTRYREVIGKYTVELRKVASEILEMISQGLGLSADYFSGDLNANPTVLVNHYPVCPEPSLALGLAKHRDPSIITLVHQQNIPGLQVLLDGNWVVVQPISHALIVNIGYVLQVISNGKVKGAEHRVVTNSSSARTTASLFIYPSNDAIIKPDTTLLDDSSNRPFYRAIKYKDFRSYFLSISADARKVHDFMDTSNN